MRGTWIKRLLLLVGAVGVMVYFGIFLKNGHQHSVDTKNEMDTPCMKTSSNLEERISDLSEFSQIKVSLLDDYYYY